MVDRGFMVQEGREEEDMSPRTVFEKELSELRENYEKWRLERKEKQEKK